MVYFRFEGKEMVAVIGDRSVFDKHRERGRRSKIILTLRCRGKRMEPHWWLKN